VQKQSFEPVIALQLAEQLLGEFGVLLGLYPPSDYRTVPQVQYDIGVKENTADGALQ
jgi:hypothetical protein